MFSFAYSVLPELAWRLARPILEVVAHTLGAEKVNDTLVAELNGPPERAAAVLRAHVDGVGLLTQPRVDFLQLVICTSFGFTNSLPEGD